MSKAFEEIAPTTVKTMWRTRKEKKTKLLIDRETQLRYLRRCDLVKDTIKRIVLQTRLARRRCSSCFGNRTWGDTKTSFAATEKRIKVAQRRCRIRDKAFKAVVREIFKARSETSRGAKARNIAPSAPRKHARTIASKLQSSATMNSEAMPTRRAAVSASFPKRLATGQMLQPATSRPLQTTAEHIAQSNDKPRNRGHVGVPSVETGHFSDIATASSSQPGDKLSQLPLGPLDLADPPETLPVWAQWFVPPLSATQVECVRKRMRQPEAYLRMGSTQREKAVADDVSAALRLMCQTSNQSIRFRWKYQERLEKQFLRRESDDVFESKSTPGAGFNVEKQATISGIHRPIRANSASPAESSPSENTGESDHASRKRRKITEPSSQQIHLGHHEDDIESSPGVAHIPRRDESHPTTSPQTTEELLKLMGKRKNRSNVKEGLQRYTSLRSSTSHTGASVTPGLPNKTKIGNPPASMSDRHQDSKRDREKKGPDVNIPTSTKMATDLRPYSQWPGTYESHPSVNQGLTVMSK